MMVQNYNTYAVVTIAIFPYELYFFPWKLLLAYDILFSTIFFSVWHPNFCRIVRHLMMNKQDQNMNFVRIYLKCSF